MQADFSRRGVVDSSVPRNEHSAENAKSRESTSNASMEQFYESRENNRRESSRRKPFNVVWSLIKCMAYISVPAVGVT